MPGAPVICQPLSIEVHSRSGVKMSSKANHVVVFVQENHTTDNYFRSMAAWGANVATGWPTATNPPAKDQPHDRHAYARWLAAQQAGTATPAFRAQFDTTAVLPFYAYLAATGAFLENHCSGFGTNSTPNHLLIVGGQSPTLRNPPRSAPQPEWDMPSLPGHAADHGLTWTCYTGTSGYPVEFYTQLKGSPNIVRHDRIGADAANLPALSMVWHDSPYDEHPVADITLGHNQIWTDVAAVAAAGHWDDTVFLLTWDDWGGYDDHVVTPNVEHTPDGARPGRSTYPSHARSAQPPHGTPGRTSSVSLTSLLLIADASTVSGECQRALMTGLLGTTYSMTQASYDLARLRRNGLIIRRPHTNTYDLTADGLRFAVFYTKIHDRVLSPLFAADQPQAPPELRAALHTLDLHIDQRLAHARLPAAA